MHGNVLSPGPSAQRRSCEAGPQSVVSARSDGNDSVVKTSSACVAEGGKAPSGLGERFRAG